MLTRFALFVITALGSAACSGSLSETSASDLTEKKNVTILESSAEGGILKSSLLGTVERTTVEKAAETFMNVSAWSALETASGNPVFSKVTLERDNKMDLADGPRLVNASVFVATAYGDVQIPVTLTAKQSDGTCPAPSASESTPVVCPKIVTIKLTNAKVTKLFKTVIESGGLSMSLVVKPLGEGGVTITGSFAVALKEGKENAPTMELLGPLYDWAKPRMKE
jgi:hypothetical protein